MLIKNRFKIELLWISLLQRLYIRYIVKHTVYYLCTDRGGGLKCVSGLFKISGRRS